MEFGLTNFFFRKKQSFRFSFKEKNKVLYFQKKKSCQKLTTFRENNDFKIKLNSDFNLKTNIPFFIGVAQQSFLSLSEFQLSFKGVFPNIFGKSD